MGQFISYSRRCARRSLKSSWAATTGLSGAVLGGGAVTLLGSIHFMSGDDRLAQTINGAITTAIYAICAWTIILILRMIFVAPFEEWKEQKAKISGLEARLKQTEVQDAHAAMIKELNRRKSKISQILHDYCNSYDETPTALHALIDQATPYINAELKADGENWTFNEKTRNELGFPPSRNVH
jgi:hypothetical protein